MFQISVDYVGLGWNVLFNNGWCKVRAIRAYENDFLLFFRNGDYGRFKRGQLVNVRP